ncbi:hypothetical protein [Tissierella praeacuta]|nr:hypothetical protein [Tissierella praeacuta]
MTTNFDFLKNQSEYILFAESCIEVERVLSTSATMSAIGSKSL